MLEEKHFSNEVIAPVVCFYTGLETPKTQAIL